MADYLDRIGMEESAAYWRAEAENDSEGMIDLRNSHLSTEEFASLLEKLACFFDDYNWKDVAVIGGK